MTKQDELLISILLKFGVPASDAEAAVEFRSREAHGRYSGHVNESTFIDYLCRIVDENRFGEKELIKVFNNTQYNAVCAIALSEAIMRGCDEENERRVLLSLLFHLHVEALKGRWKADADSEIVERFSQTKQAERARRARAASPDSEALSKAIFAELQERVVTNPYKEALSMLDGVNERLRGAGFPPVKIGKIYRRLKNHPTLLKSGEKSTN